MDTIISYTEHCLESFEERPFCSVDSLILSWASYLHMPAYIPYFDKRTAVPLKELFRAENFEAMFQGVWMPDCGRKLLTALAASPRFRDIGICGYTEQLDTLQEKQFSAVTFRLTPALNYVAFRGTNATLVGWKEDFNMAFQFPIPSQEAAAEYLKKAAGVCTGNIIVGGHSKGGNMAVYAAAMCESSIQKRIEKVYSHDGPGFLEQFLNSDAYKNICGKIEKTIPQSSIVGMLLESQEDYRIVKSSRVSIWQHDPFSWVVDGEHFHILQNLTSDAKYLDHSLSTWLSQISAPERERFVDTLYNIVTVSEATTFEELFANWQKNLPAILHAAAETDPETRDFLICVIKKLAGSFIHLPKKPSLASLFPAPES